MAKRRSNPGSADSLFQFRRRRSKNSRIAEILKDQAPFWEYLPGAKKNFRFGIRKATAILACMDYVREFDRSKGKRPLTNEPISVSSRPWNVNCLLVRHDGFEKSGKWYDVPYLQIQGSSEPISFGRTKSRALIELEKDLFDFVVDNYGYWDEDE